MVAASISVSSRAFSNGGAIPARYTSSGADVSPPVNWAGVPDGAQSLGLTVIDPDAPCKPFVHWDAPIEEIAKQGEFRPVEITKDAFEQVWHRASGAG